MIMILVFSPLYVENIHNKKEEGKEKKNRSKQKELDVCRHSPREREGWGLFESKSRRTGNIWIKIYA